MKSTITTPPALSASTVAARLTRDQLVRIVGDVKATLDMGSLQHDGHTPEWVSLNPLNDTTPEPTVTVEMTLQEAWELRLIVGRIGKFDAKNLYAGAFDRDKAAKHGVTADTVGQAAYGLYDALYEATNSL